jgi:hypothetical protein
MAATEVFLESGKRWVFACALAWPGWCRRGKGEEAALEALAEYAPRYAAVAELAKLDGERFPAAAADAFDVVERQAGNATTDFGAPAIVAAADGEPLSGQQAARATALVQASWAYLGAVLAAAPAQLRKGPRGGGRDRDKMAAHVLGAESAYARKLGLRFPEPAIDDEAAIAAMRAGIAGVLSAPTDGAPLVPKGWPVRYVARRIAWHALDHAWEIEDRSE